MGFSPNFQFAKNVGLVVECCECNKWRVLYSKSKLNSIEITTLERYIDSIQYICGDSFDILADNTKSSQENNSNNNKRDRR